MLLVLLVLVFSSRCAGLASYLSQRCDLAIEVGVTMMGAPAVPAAATSLFVVSGQGYVDWMGPKQAYVEFVVEVSSSSDLLKCDDGIVGCGGTRCAVRRFGGSEKLVQVRPGAVVKTAHATKFGAVSVQLPSVVWELHVGCDRSGFLNEFLGYAAALRNVLRESGSRLSLQGLSCSDERDDLFDDEAEAVFHLQNTQPTHNALKIAHGSCPKGRVDVARVMVEREHARGRDVAVYDCARRARQVWTPTRWGAEQFAAAGIEGVRVVPEAVDPLVFSRDAVDNESLEIVRNMLPEKKEATWRVLCIAKWESRKGLDRLVDAIYAMNRDDVELVLHSYRPSWMGGEKNIQKIVDARRPKNHRAKSSRVVWLGDRQLSRKLVRALYASVDAFALTTRGEGWGLPLHEAMLMQLPCVVTNSSGIIDLVGGEDSALLLPNHGVDDEGYANGNTPEEIAAGLEILRTDLRLARMLGQNARDRTLHAFNPRKVALRMRDEIRHLLRTTTQVDVHVPSDIFVD